MPIVSVPAPFGGQNNKDGIYVLDQRFATKLYNWVPGPGYLDSRGPVTQYSSNSLAPDNIYAIWQNANGAGVFATTTSIYAVATVIGAPLATGFASGFWHGNLWQNRTILCNGVDTPQIYDGATVVPIVAAGPTLTNLFGSTTFKGRVYYWENNARVFWYAAAGAFQGALTSFDLSTFTRGDGYLVSIAPLTIDGGAGPDDILAFLFSNGEVLVYQGDDPGSATAWQQVGRFVIGEMLGRDCWAIVGSATLVATSIGVVDLARALSSGAVDDSSVAGNNFGASNMAALDNAGGTANNRKLIFDQKNRILWLYLYNPSTLVVEGFSLIHGMDIESRSWFTLQGVAWESSLIFLFGTNNRKTTASGLISDTVLCAANGRLLNGPDRINTSNASDYFNVEIAYFSLQQNLHFGQQELNKLCTAVALNIQKVAPTINLSTYNIYVGSGPIATSLTSSINYRPNPETRAFNTIPAYGSHLVFQTFYIGNSGYRWFSSEFMIKPGNSL